MCASKKNEWFNNAIKQIEKNQKRNETRKFFIEIKKLKQQNTRLSYMCKNVNNTVITHVNQNLNRLKEHFCTILKSDSEDSFSYYRVQAASSDCQMDTEILFPSFNEVCSRISKLKSNKAGGTDNIPYFLN
jgi:hypothetical protein